MLAAGLDKQLLPSVSVEAETKDDLFQSARWKKDWDLDSPPSVTAVIGCLCLVSSLRIL